MSFLMIYVPIVIVLMLYLGMAIKFEGYEHITRGMFILYMVAALCPVLNVITVILCTVMMAGYLYERYGFGKWLAKPLIKPKE